MAVRVRRGIAILVVVACGEGASSTSTTTTTSSSATTTTTSSASTSTPTSSESSTSHDSSGESGTTAAAPACNGSAALCDRPIDRVTFPTTHNSAAATEYGFAAINANQTHGLRRQLDDGIRGFMLDVTLDGDATVLCHGPCALGQIPHADALSTFGEFLAEDPGAVVVVIYQDDAPTDAIAADWETAGLVEQAVVLDGVAWPTLGELVAADTRIVVTAENGGPPPAWFHHAWAMIWDTPYTFHSLREMSCDGNRGEPGTGLFLVNHWLSTDLDLPDESRAAEANAYDVLLARADACAGQWRHPVNLLGVDFYEQGDLLAVVAELNLR